MDFTYCMTSNWKRLVLITAILGLCFLQSGIAQDDVAGIPSEDIQINKDKNKRYFLIGPKEGCKAPEEGFKLLIILPGGGGTADFHPFVKRIYKHALGDNYIAVQPVAFQWTTSQKTVWPVDKDKKTISGMKFSTEDFVAGIIADVKKKYKLNQKYIFTLSWSSSGPTAYAMSASRKTSTITGSYVSMSVFHPNRISDINLAKGHSYYIEHSKEDKICVGCLYMKTLII